MSIERQRSPRSHTAAFLQAVEQAGFPVETPNRPEPAGFAETMVSQRRGARFSTADAYLRPARKRRNLTIRTDAQVRRVVIENGRAVGVEVQAGELVRHASARREVVLCGGAVNTPTLLMHSGIGDPDALSRWGIPLAAASPEVGAHLTDHLIAGLVTHASGDTLYAAEHPTELARYLLRREGMLTSNVAEAYGFVRTADDLDLPDVEILFAPVAYVAQGLEKPPAHGLTIGAILLQPKSSGTITLSSADPLVAPLIDPAYLSDPAGSDRATLLAGLAICERILEQPALRADGPLRFMVPEGADSMSAADRDTLALNTFAHTLYHPVGTARMGRDHDSVVDPQLRVRGVDGLRVADASVMPSIIRGHTNAPSIVIGERAADLLSGRHAF